MYRRRTWADHVLPMFCPSAYFLSMFCACSFHGNSVNNLLSYCVLIDAKIRASDKDLPVKHPGAEKWNTFMALPWHILLVYSRSCNKVRKEKKAAKYEKGHCMSASWIGMLAAISPFAHAWLCTSCSIQPPPPPLAKGQLISKCLFGIFNSPKKRTKKFNFTTILPQVKLFSLVFWENWRHQKDILKLTDL